MKYRQNKKEFLSSLLRKIFFTIALAGLLILIYDSGFEKSTEVSGIIGVAYQAILLSWILFIINTNLFNREKITGKVRIVDGLLILLFIILLVELSDIEKLTSFWLKLLINIAIILFFIRTISSLQFNYSRQYLNPAQIFIISFISIILFGTFYSCCPMQLIPV